MKLSRLGVLSGAVLIGSTFAGGLMGNRVLAGGGELSEELRLYTAMLAAIESDYVEEVPSDRLVSTSIRQMLHTLDPHSSFFEQRDYQSMQERQKGQYYGLGISVQSIDGNITVVAPFEGTPAHRLGIRAGDIISRIEGEDARGMSIDDAVKRLRGPKGTPVRITIVREGYETPLEFTVIRDAIPLHSVPYSFMVSPSVGYIRLTDFNETTACRPGEGEDCERELEQALKKLQKQGARAFVLDIRDNPGGLLDQAFAVSNLFLKKGQLVVFTRGRSRRDESNYITESESPWVDVPLVVLTSRHSASASEIVAGALQDHDRALIVGETTFGKGLVQTILPLRNVRGYALALTTARYYTPSGRSIQREYATTALEDYYAPRDRKACTEAQGEAKLTDAGRTVYGGDGITPDYCVEPDKPSKFVSYLIGRQAFTGFSRGFAAAGGQGDANIVGTGTRSQVESDDVTLVARDFEVNDELREDFREYIESRKLRFTPEDLEENRVVIDRLIEEQIRRQVFGEGAARRASIAWDPQVQRALELIPRAELLIKDPDGFVAQREQERRLADASGAEATALP
ncbi:MAG: S41 family peptidase [Acidobacteria bacterium]|jgi:carboxyl-terminal processing protease|nr:S41 family peptidase [Acidobacteriota bacterium]